MDYFLTSAISGVSGLYYLSSLMPDTKSLVILASMILFLVLVLINIVGIKESASVTSSFATVEIIVTFLLIGASIFYITFKPSYSWSGWWQQHHPSRHPPDLQFLMIGYATTWLAYSGLESVAQISGAMKEPIKKTASKAMWWVIIVVALITSPMTSAVLYILPEA